MKDFFKKMIHSFLIITTGSLFCTTLFITFLVPHDTFGISLLWQIIIFSLFGTAPNIIFYSSKELSKNQLLLRKGIHYIILNIALLGCALYFNWFKITEIGKSIIFIVMVFMVYIVVCLSCFAGGKIEADKLNKRLQQYQKSKK